MPKILNEQQGGSVGSPHSDVGFLPTTNEQPNDLFREMCVIWLAINLIETTPRRVRRAMKKHVDDVVEAIKKFGCDPRAYSIVTKSIVDDGNGNVAGI